MRADLHIHTCLSPCAELEMSPRAIARQAKIRKIDIIGICDHNSAENAAALIEAAAEMNVTALPGLEVTSVEEVHILALFDDLDAALELQSVIYSQLSGVNDEEAFGMQVVVNAGGEVLRFNQKLLIGATTLSVDRVIRHIHDLDGLAIASHIDRPSFSLISQLGFIPEELPLDALEISPLTTIPEARRRFNPLLPLTTSSDAHTLEEIGRTSTAFQIHRATVTEMRMALENRGGRRIIH